MRALSKRRMLLCASALLMIDVATIPAARAQAAPAKQGAPPPEEVVVTASRKSEKLSKTPAAITAISGESLTRSGVTDITSLQNVVPDLSVGDQFGVNRTFIRGIGMTSIDLGADGAVAFLQDGAQISRPAAQLAGFYDVARVEVLRGPQGTLYGRGATAGAVNIITNQPTPELSGYARVTVGNYGLVTTQDAISGPLIPDKLLVRLALNIDEHDGYGKNLYTGTEIDNQNAKAVRGSATYIFNPELTATVSGELYNEHDDDYAFHYFGPTIVPEGALPYNLAHGQSIFGYYAALGQTPNLRNIYSGVDPLNRRDGSDVTATIDWHPGDLDLKSITSYHGFGRLNDDDLSVSNKSPNTIYGLNQYIEKSQTESQEFVGNYTASNWSALFGAMYFHESNLGSVYVPTPGIALLLDPTGALGPVVDGILDHGEYLQQGTVVTDAYGAYAQGTYNILPNLKITAGARYNYEQRAGNGAFVFTALGADIPTDKAAKWAAVTPKFTVDYELDNNTLLYATIERGFKSGVIDIGSTNPVVKPEYVWDYEAGIKDKFLDQRLSTALSVFYYDYTDLQVGFVNAESIVETVNAASARNYGVEFESHWAVTDPLTLDFFATYLNAEFTKFLDADYRDNFQFVQLAGNTLPNAPKFTTRFGATYNIPMAEKGDVLLHAEGNYQSRVYFTEFNNSDATQGAHALFDAFARYTAPGGRWTLDLWGKNLTDRFVIANNIVAAATFGYVRVGSLLPPRTFGATFGYKF